MLHSTKLINKILIILMALLLLFSTNYGAFKTSEAYANTWTTNYEEWASATYATVVTGTLALATGAMHAEQYLKDNVDAMYQTAKESWTKMAPDMKQNFLSSLDQMADGIVTVGDWITGALDALKPTFGDNTGTSVGGVKYTSLSSGGHAMLSIENVSSDSLLLTYTDSNNAKSRAYSSFEVLLKSGTFGDKNDYAKIYVNGSGKASINLGELSLAEYNVLAQAASNVKTPAGMISFGATIGARISLEYQDGTVVSPDASTYSRLDEWIRERAIPNGQLGVYNPGAQAYTQDGYRLGLSTDGQTLLQLPDGIPWEGVADWKQPLLNTVDGTTAVLDTAVGSWIDVATGVKIRDATVPEIASGTGVDESIAEYVFIRAKDEEKAREAEDTETGENLSRAQKRNLETLDNIVEGHLKDSDFTGTLRDLQGNPVPKPGGGYWNHLKEMKDSYKGLNKIKKGLEGSLKNPNLDETERKILQEALDKVNRYIKKIEDLFSGYGGMKKMSISKKIGEIYNLPAPHKNDEHSLEQWYMELYNKQIDDISTMDVIRMLEQNILEGLAFNKAIEYLREDPLAGSKFDGQLMETLLSTDLNKLNDSIGDIKELVSEVSLKLNELDWVSIEDKEEYAELLKEFQGKLTENI
ncbi:contact-dependent growth inhibition system immunity protein [Lysinibacillus sp. NPDC093688]|uniref:contact-dependent growth inhibition system immunity protein n=1 Tax=Lysinibacillus sp. NPDC093688 TaxID=3390577 RepID=UPI003CFD0E8C